MKNSYDIPKSAATKNLFRFMLIITIALVLITINAPRWLIWPTTGIAFGFLLACIACIFDIQEYVMKQNQQIIELLKRKKNDET